MNPFRRILAMAKKKPAPPMPARQNDTSVVIVKPPLAPSASGRHEAGQPEPAMKIHFCWNCGKSTRMPKAEKPGRCPACEKAPR